MNLLRTKEITLREAAQLTGYTRDYIGSLIRDGKIPGRRVVGTAAWMTSKSAVIEHARQNQQGRMASRRIRALERLEDAPGPSGLQTLLLPSWLALIQFVSFVLLLISLFGLFLMVYLFFTVRVAGAHDYSTSESSDRAALAFPQTNDR